jgi:hypothetical protein
LRHGRRAEGVEVHAQPHNPYWGIWRELAGGEAGAGNQYVTGAGRVPRDTGRGLPQHGIGHDRQQQGQRPFQPFVRPRHHGHPPGPRPPPDPPLQQLVVHLEHVRTQFVERPQHGAAAHDHPVPGVAQARRAQRTHRAACGVDGAGHDQRAVMPGSQIAGSQRVGGNPQAARGRRMEVGQRNDPH